MKTGATGLEKIRRAEAFHRLGAPGALAADRDVLAKSGRVFTTPALAREYASPTSTGSSSAFLETAALEAMPDGLSSAAKALEYDDDELAASAIANLRDLRDDLSELGRIRRASARVARRSLAWRSRLEPVVHEQENAGHLDLLGSSCLVLARTAASLG